VVGLGILERDWARVRAGCAARLQSRAIDLESLSVEP
jgi:hypothetical protein